MANKSSKFKKGIVLEPQTSAPSSPVKGEAYYDDNDNKLKIHNGTTFKQALDADDLSTHEADTSTHGVGTIVGTTETQTLTNKDIDGGTASNSNRITLPKASKATLDGLTRKEATLVYADDLDKVYYDDGTNLRAVGSGSGSDINYIDNGDAEIGTTGWATYNDASETTDDSLPFNGTAGTANITLTQNTSNPLRGNADYLITKDVVNRQGQGVSYDFTINRADQAKQLVISFDKKPSANYVTGDMRVYVYDVTNATLIRVNGEDIGSEEGVHYARFQTSSNSTSYRLIFHVASTSILSYTVNFDNVKVGPKAIVYGSPMTDWTSYTPTLTSTTNVSANDFRYRRVGGNMEIEGRITWIGVGAGSNFTISLPTGFSIDSSIANSIAGETHFGTATWTDSGTSFKSLHVRRSDTSNLSLWEIGANNIFDGTQTAAGDVVSLQASVPIAGWSANSAMSEDFSGRDVKVSCSGNTGIAITANSTLVTFTEVEDTTASFNSSTTFTAPEKGEYLFTGCTKYTTNVARFTRPVVNGSHNGEFSGIFSSTATVNPFTFKLKLERGDTVAFQETVGGTLDNTSAHYLKIEKLQSAQQLFETETVAAIYQSCTQNIATSTNTILTYDDLIKDTHNAYNLSTGNFTAPYSGYYHISANSGITSGSVDTGRAYMYITTPYGDVVGNRILMTTINVMMVVTGTIYLNKGETASVGINQTSGTTRAMNSSSCNLSIIRVK